MTWSYHNQPGTQVSPSEYWALIAEAAGPDPLYRVRTEMRRQMRMTTAYAWAASVSDPYPIGGGRYRIACIGLPYRAWRFREILGQLHTLHLDDVRCVLANTHQTSELGLIGEALTDTVTGSITVPLARVGDAVLGTLDAAGEVAEGIADAAPDVGAGLADAVRGAGGAVASAGTAAAFSGTLTLIVVLGVLAVGYAMSTGALKIKPITLGGG